HKGACLSIQRLTTGGEYLVDNRRHFIYALLWNSWAALQDVILEWCRVCYCFPSAWHPCALAHSQPPISASVSGFSNLAYSVWAARSRWAMRTGSCASAARKEAFRAILRMFPPA